MVTTFFVTDFKVHFSIIYEICFHIFIELCKVTSLYETVTKSTYGYTI